MVKVVREYDPAVDYTAELTEEEVKTEKGGSFVYLRGLERLAKERGIITAEIVSLIPFQEDKGVIVTYRYVFADGSSYSGSADATVKNCNGKFSSYLTAMAESRAKARALRNAFGISMCSVEEKVDDGPPAMLTDESEEKITDHQLAILRVQAKKKGLTQEQIVELAKSRKKTVKDFTRGEARKAITALNKLKG